MHDSTPLWRSCREFRFKTWSDGAVIYETESGDTHHLTLTTLQTLQLIQQAPCTLQQIIEHLRHTRADTPSQSSDEQVAVEASILSLNELGFIEPIPL